MDVLVCDSYEEMSERAARLVLDQLGKKPDSRIMLASGRTVVGLYRLLEQKGGFSRCSFFGLDEFVGVPPDDPRSFNHFLSRFIKETGGRSDLMDGSQDPEQECARYDKTIGGMDLTILGIGENAHIAFNEPGTKFSARTHVASLDERTRRACSRYFSEFRDTPHMAMTVGPANILESSSVVLLASGKNKSVAIRDCLEGDIMEAVPASILRRHPNATFIIDKAAASGLRQ